MKNWKDKVLGIFAGIGIMSLLMASNSQQANVNYGTPKSHVWTLHEVRESDGITRAYLVNAITGDVRKLARGWPSNNNERQNGVGETYITMRPYN